MHVLALWLALTCAAGGERTHSAGLAAAQDRIVPQTMLSTCPALRIAEWKDARAGELLAVSGDATHMAWMAHTAEGAQITFESRGAAAQEAEEAGAAAAAPLRLQIPRAPMPEVVGWRLLRAEFSADNSLLIVSAAGTLHVIDATAARLLYALAFEAASDRVPGDFSLAGGTLAVLRWPAETMRTESKPHERTEVRLVDVGSGKWLRSLMLPLASPPAWTRLLLSPDAKQAAVLERATRWPGKARLSLYNVEDAQRAWQMKLDAEDIAWSPDGSQVLALGRKLLWIEAASGKARREFDLASGRSEHQRLRADQAANLAVAQFARYSMTRRALGGRDARNASLRIWRLDSGQMVCSRELSAAERIETWLTPAGELVALEEALDPASGAPRTARMVVYRAP